MIREIHKKGAVADPLRGLFTATTAGKPVVEDEATEARKRVTPSMIADNTMRAWQGAVEVSQDQCRVVQRDGVHEATLRDKVCRLMEGGRETFARCLARLGREV